MTLSTPVAASENEEAFDGPTRPVRAVETVPRDRGLLVETRGQRAGCPHALHNATSTIGRSPGCTVQLDDPTLSRVHARVRRVDAGFLLEDLRSTNGCWVNDHRVERVVLQDGDRVRLSAMAVLRFQLVTEEEERALSAAFASGTTDGLTGVGNRRFFEERLRGEYAYAHRHATPLSLILADVDRFKLVNDVYGHPGGDAVLRGMGLVLTGNVRTEDLVARYGGEEFAVILRGIGVEGAARLAERLRRAVEVAEIPHGAAQIRVTASFGVASLECLRGVGERAASGGAPAASPRGKGTAADLVARADERLYQAKRAGRNRVVAG